MITVQKNLSIRFAICVNTDDPDLLTPRMVYQVLPDEDAAKSGYLRVIDNEGEDYLYPARYFVLVEDFPQPVPSQHLKAVVLPLHRNSPNQANAADAKKRAAD
jgi:hypothetical protein